jgi:MoxR-like ATPase
MASTLRTPAQWLESVHDAIGASGYVVKNETLIRFYAALRAKPFVILAGNSGTGKSRLVRLFAEACGASVENGGFHLIAVRPDWNDSGDLLGHLDLENQFRPGQIFNALLVAHAEPKRAVFVCLDEMNLARVEHYFSDFLSKIESRRRSDDGSVITDPVIRAEELTAKLFDRVPDYLRTALQKLQSAGRGINLPPNLLIVGTVNMDETTHAFSRKVLDRANTLEIEAGPLSAPPSSAKVATPTSQSIDLRAPFLTASDMLPDAENASKLQRVSKLLDELNDTLAEASLQVAYRTRDEATAFFIHATAAGLSDQDTEHAIVMQKILPRVQGSSPRLARVLHKLLIRFNPGAGLDADDASKLPDQLLALRRDTANPALVRKLAGMWLVYIEEGFTSFWIA